MSEGGLGVLGLATESHFMNLKVKQFVARMRVHLALSKSIRSFKKLNLPKGPPRRMVIQVSRPLVDVRIRLRNYKQPYVSTVN